MGYVKIDIYDKNEPFVATAIHAGSLIPEIYREYYLPVAEEFYKEEDPGTENLVSVFPNRITVRRSRFAVDLNRFWKESLYKEPLQNWYFDRIWKKSPDTKIKEEASSYYDTYYKNLEKVVSELLSQHKKIIVMDIHSFNYRGPHEGNKDRQNTDIVLASQFAKDEEDLVFLKKFKENLSLKFDQNKKIKVSENTFFKGGYHSQFLKEKFGDRVIPFAIEFRKFYMDEGSKEINFPLLQKMSRDLRKISMTTMKEVGF